MARLNQRNHYVSLLAALFAGRRGPVTSSPRPVFSLPALRLPRPRAYAYASASEARLAVCRRMHSRRLAERLRRGTWSKTSLAAARRTLSARGLES